MPASDPNLLALSDGQRQVVESWFAQFDQAWADGLLAAWVCRLPPPNDARRRPALVELVKIDLERRWQIGQPRRLEEYLQAYPELGTPETTPVDLVQAEYEVCCQFGANLGLADFARRFPRQVEQLRPLPPPDRVAPASVETPRTRYSTVRPQSPNSLAPPPAAVAVPVATAAAELPEQFGRYRIDKKLGQGGMGAVYLAHDTKLDRPVALKVPRFMPDDGPEVLERFYREARAAATLDHPNICPVYDVGEVNGVHFLTMAYIKGKALAEYVRAVKAGKPLPPRQVAAVVRKLAVALQEAHRRGVIHRDLKPANVMVNHRKEPVIMDFGLARRVNTADIRLTQSGALLGTPAYMSPEQVEGDQDRIGPLADVYSLGVIFYELLTGRLPFAGPLAALLVQVVTQEPEPPSKHRPDLEPALETICLKAMAKKIQDRYASMADLATALSEYLKSGSQAGAAASVSTVDEQPRQAPTTHAPSGQLFAEMVAAYSIRPATIGQPKKTSPNRRVPPWLWVAAAGAAAACLLFGIVILIRNKDGSTTRIEVPETASIEIQNVDKSPLIPGLREGARTKGSSAAQPISAEGKRSEEKKAGPVLQAVASPLDALDPNDIPPPEKYDWQPKELVAVLGEHRWRPGGYVNRITYSPDGKFLATTGWNGSRSLFIWRAATGSIYAIPDDENSHHHGVGVAFSPDGRTLAVGNKDGELKIYDLATCKELMSRKEHSNVIQSIAFAPDGKTFATGSNDKTIKIWDAVTGRVRETMSGHTHPILSVAFSPDGNTIASGGMDKTVKLWDVKAAKERATFHQHTDEIRSVAFSPKGDLLASGSNDRTVRLWSISPGKEKEIAVLKKNNIGTSVAFSADDKTLVTGGDDQDNAIKVWDIGTMKEHAAFNGHIFWVNCLAFAPDGTKLASGGWDETIRVWDMQSRKEVTKLWSSITTPPRASVTPDGRKVALVGSSGAIELWSVPPIKKPIIMRGGHFYYVNSVAVAKDGEIVVSGSGHGVDKTARLWDIITGKESAVLTGHDDVINAVDISKDERTIATGSNDKTIKIWDRLSGVCLTTLRGHTGAVTSLAFSSDGQVIGSGGSDQTARIWEATPSGRSPMILRGHAGEVTSMVFHPDGQQILTGSTDKTVRLWDMTTGQRRGIYQHEAEVRSVTVTPDGEFLASSDSSGRVIIWETASGYKRKEWKLPWPVQKVAFTENGRHLVLVNRNVTAYILRIAAVGSIGKRKSRSEADKGGD